VAIPIRVRIAFFGFAVVALTIAVFSVLLYSLIAAGAPEGQEQQLRGLRNFLWLSAGITLLAVSAAMWVMAGRALRPLEEMARAADEIGHARDLSRRLPAGRANDEVSRLTASFNGMLARLEEAYRQTADALESQRRFVSDASHELRTPLTSIRSNAGFLLGRPDARPEDVRAALEDVAEESGRMSRLIESLLTLARADAGLHLDRTAVDLEALVREVARQVMALHQDRSFRVRVLPDAGGSRASGDAPDLGTVLVSGNEDALRQLIWILVENAVRHVHQSGTIWLTLSRRGGPSEGETGSLVWLQMADDGVGIPDADLERIFERFYRADASRTGEGTGLGLAIARWIVTDHGGRLWARNNELGGATFTVELPAAECEPDPPTPAEATADLGTPRLSSSS